MDTAIVKLDSLADTIGTTTQDHNFTVFSDLYLIRGIIGGEIIGGIFYATYRDRLPCLGKT